MIPSIGKRGHASSAHATRHRKVPTLADWQLTTFREQAFSPQRPALLPPDACHQLPASQLWFTPDNSDPSSHTLNDAYLRPYRDTIVTLELTQLDPQTGTDTFTRFDAPLQLFLDWMQEQQQVQPQQQPRNQTSPTLYLAQHPLSSLPPALQSNLQPAPSPVLHAHRGDIYDANLWLGLPPTHTSLHRDPNPNFFVQLAGTKVVRLFRPDHGRDIFEHVQRELGAGARSSRFRGEEMMQGRERELLEREVWDQANEGGEMEGAGHEFYEAVVERGMALFIPLGWWHSIKSVGTGVSGSVNWWFR